MINQTLCWCQDDEDEDGGAESELDESESEGEVGAEEERQTERMEEESEWAASHKYVSTPFTAPSGRQRPQARSTEEVGGNAPGAFR